MLIPYHLECELHDQPFQHLHSHQLPADPKLLVYQVEYSLTKKGKALDPILALMAEFSFQYEPEKIFRDKKPRHVKQYFGTEFLSEVYD